MTTFSEKLSQPLLQQLSKQGVLPVLQIETIESVVPLAEILTASGFSIMEITLRSDIALAAIELIKTRFSDSILSAGTVLTPEQVDHARASGAEFVISPGFNPVTFKHAASRKLPMIPGVNSPSDIEQALQCGISLLKFFPAEASGGTTMIKSLLGPYQNIQFIPTGGINLSNLASYLAIPQVVACGGTWLATVDDLRHERWDEIEKKVIATRRFIDQL